MANTDASKKQQTEEDGDSAMPDTQDMLSFTPGTGGGPYTIGGKGKTPSNAAPFNAFNDATFQQLISTVHADAQKICESMGANIFAKMQDLVQAQADYNEKQHNELREQLANIDKRHEKSEQTQKEVADTLATLTSKFDKVQELIGLHSGASSGDPSASAASATAAQIAQLAANVQDVNDLREPDHTIIKISCSKKFAIDDASSIFDFIENYVSKEEYEVVSDGTALSKEHVVQFKGGSITGARRAGKVLQGCKIGSGKYKQFFVKCPQNTGPDMATVSNERVYLNADKCPRQTKMEFAFRKLKPILAKHIQDRPFMEWGTGTVTSNWKGIVRIDFKTDGDASLAWAPQRSAELGLPTEEITTEFHEAFKASRRVSSWL